uniref:Uncharacterized protein n=1 Tax=Chromera velia CCMP2878 TaxID=1169474 RepID=A0A0G4GKZ5_9ALVE|eukprot:Cvel_22377.t1-p1 / transcript=Cvel_22377.t1 / gene=Cvel_22377 / organism=Chromera_velia_CCMP2878 / gene_product=hypothetical protein / transcript_product=hypothetical protein / location=Cvel_scaffold2193:16626-17279(-) / protein_length=218 / sequence_SO=supercontig / SO=protein_coding / is_pseudo=false
MDRKGGCKLEAQPPLPPLPVGEWVSPSWERENSESNVCSRALVLWNLDCGTWDLNRVSSWISSMEVLLRNLFRVELCILGAMGKKSCGRRHWRKVAGGGGLPDRQADDLRNLWNSRATKLVVLPAIEKGAGARFLHEAAFEMIRSQKKPYALVFPSHNNKNEPMLDEARKEKVKTVVLHWADNRKDTGLMNCKPDMAFLAEKDPGCPIQMPSVGSFSS